eukprot:14834953-Ditylum_brightwellii.AAC.1
MVITDENEKDKKVEKYNSIQECIADCGAKYVGGTNQHQTLVKVEFHIRGKAKAFPARVELISLLNKLKKGDEELKCCLSDNTREWNDFADLPIGTEFEQQFNRRHDIYTHTKKKMIYLHLDTKLKFNELKHKAEVCLYLS